MSPGPRGPVMSGSAWGRSKKGGSRRLPYSRLAKFPGTNVLARSAPAAQWARSTRRSGIPSTLHVLSPQGRPSSHPMVTRPAPGSSEWARKARRARLGENYPPAPLLLRRPRPGSQAGVLNPALPLHGTSQNAKLVPMGARSHPQSISLGGVRETKDPQPTPTQADSGSGPRA